MGNIKSLSQKKIGKWGVSMLLILSCCLCFLQCKTSPNKSADVNPTEGSIALAFYSKGQFDSALLYWNKAIEKYKAQDNWDSIFALQEKYIVAHSRIFRIAEGHRFLDTLSLVLSRSSVNDSIEWSKIWVRRSELLYSAALPLLAKDTLQAALALRQRQLEANHPLIADAYDYLQIATHQQHDYWAAVQFGEKGIAAYKTSLATGSPSAWCSNLPWVIGNTGESYLALGLYDKGIPLLQEAYDSLTLSQASLDSRMYYLHLIATGFRLKGDYRQAVFTYNGVLDSLQNSDAKSFKADAYRGLAICYKETGLEKQMLEKAQLNYDLNKEIYQKLNHGAMATSAILMADCLLDAGNTVVAENYASEAIRIYRRAHDTSTLDYLDALRLSALLLFEKNHADSAAYLLRTIISKKTALLGEDNDLVGVALLDAAQQEDARANYSDSRTDAERALRIFIRNRNPGHPFIRTCIYLLARARWLGSNDKNGALKLIESETQLQHYGAGSRTASVDRKYLDLLELGVKIRMQGLEAKTEQEFLSCLHATKALSSAYQQFLGYAVFQGAHFAEGGKTMETIKSGFLPAYQLYKLTGEQTYLQDALDFAEQSRTGSIRLALQHYEANKFANVPDSIIAQEEALRVEVASIEKLLLTTATMPATVVDNLSAALDETRRKYAQQLQIISESYPEYYRLKWNSQTVSLEGMKQLAKKSESTIVEYIQTESQLFSIVCNADNCMLQQHDISRSRLEYLITSYRTAMARADVTAYADAASQLYEAVLKPISAHLAKRSVLIIPDEALSYVSFESLLTHPVANASGFRTLPYAIALHQWQYAYSATVLEHQYSLNNGMVQSNTGNIVAMAPGFDKGVKTSANHGSNDSLYQQLLRQPWAIQLATNLRKSGSAKAITGLGATEQNYQQEVVGASAMYIGTHAFPDDNDPMESVLIFSPGQEQSPQDADGLLHAYEIYRTPVQMRLLVLGGCETGIGKIKSGEGLMSLASGYTYAGCPSIVMSLWSIDDKQSASIIHSFFQNTGRQMPIGLALATAKKEFLKSTVDDDLFNPIYWAGLVNVGLDTPLPMTVSTHFPFLQFALLIGALTMTVISFLLYLKRRSR